jgi:hypothetical protein
MTMNWRDALHHQVIRQCGDPAEQFARYGHTFGDWIDAAPGKSDVEAGVAGYLGAAARVGRRWGTVAGILLGTAAATLCFLLIRVVT